MTALDLKELDRLEREAASDYEGWQDTHLSADPDKIPACTGRECVACEFMRQQYVPYAQLRPLLDLVETMGEALERVETVLGPTVPQCGCDGCEVEMQESLSAAEDGLADYRRAKGS